MLKRFSGRFEPYPSIWKSLMNLNFGSKNAFFKLKLKNIWFVGQIKKFLSENYFFEEFRSSATFFIFIICAQNGYLWSYEPLKPHVKSSFFTRINFENIASRFTEKTVNVASYFMLYLAQNLDLTRVVGQ